MLLRRTLAAGSKFDVCIVGGGIVGCAVACELLRRAPHLRVLQLEQEDARGYHSTGRSAALTTAGYGAPGVRALCAASRGLLEGSSGGGAPSVLSPRGFLWLAGAGREERLEAFEASRGGAAGVDLRRLTARDAVELVPALREEQLAATALLEPGACDVDVSALMARYARAGVEVVCGARVVRLERRRAAGGWAVGAAVRGEQREFAAGALVNAAGAWADGVAAMAGFAPVGLRPLRRTCVTVPVTTAGDGDEQQQRRRGRQQPPPSWRSWPMCIDLDDRFYFKPEAGAMLVSLADETPDEPCDARPEELDVARCMHALHAHTHLGGGGVQPIATWAGHRTFAPDREPVLGEQLDAAGQRGGSDARVAGGGDGTGFFWAAGLGGDGIQTSPAVAALVASQVLGVPLQGEAAACIGDASLFSPMRCFRDAARS
jgi:D-arginine dehydrogenase